MSCGASSSVCRRVDRCCPPVSLVVITRAPSPWADSTSPGPGSVRVELGRAERADQLGGVGQRSSSSPTWARVPRSGSRVGTRCSESCPGTSKITESQRGGGDRAGVLRAGSGRGSRPGCPPAARSTARCTSLVADQPLHPAAGRQPVVQALLRPYVGVLQVDRLQPGAVPVQPVPPPVALEQLELGHPVQLAGQRARVGLPAGPAPTPSAPARRGSGRRRRCRSGPRRTCGPARGTPAAAVRAVSRRPSRSVTRWRQRRVVRDGVQCAGPGGPTAEVLGRGSRPRSWPAPARWCRA